MSSFSFIFNHFHFSFSFSFVLGSMAWSNPLLFTTLWGERSLIRCRAWAYMLFKSSHTFKAMRLENQQEGYLLLPSSWRVLGRLGASEVSGVLTFTKSRSAYLWGGLAASDSVKSPMYRRGRAVFALFLSTLLLVLLLLLSLWFSLWRYVTLHDVLYLVHLMEAAGVGEHGPCCAPALDILKQNELSFFMCGKFKDLMNVFFFFC